MAEEGVNAVVFAGEQSTIHLNDSNEPSFARETSQGLAAPTRSSRTRACRRRSSRPASIRSGSPTTSTARGTRLLRSGTAGDGVRVREGGPRSAGTTRYAPALKYVTTASRPPASWSAAPSSQAASCRRPSAAVVPARPAAQSCDRQRQGQHEGPGDACGWQEEEEPVKVRPSKSILVHGTYTRRRNSRCGSSPRQQGEEGEGRLAASDNK